MYKSSKRTTKTYQDKWMWFIWTNVFSWSMIHASFIFQQQNIATLPNKWTIALLRRVAGKSCWCEKASSYSLVVVSKYRRVDAYSGKEYLAKKLHSANNYLLRMWVYIQPAYRERLFWPISCVHEYCHLSVIVYVHHEIPFYLMPSHDCHIQWQKRYT